MSPGRYPRRCEVAESRYEIPLQNPSRRSPVRGVRIKPGADAPGTENTKVPITPKSNQPRRGGRRVRKRSFGRPCRGFEMLMKDTWGFRPKLYAVAPAGAGLSATDVPPAPINANGDGKPLWSAVPDVLRMTDRGLRNRDRLRCRRSRDSSDVRQLEADHTRGHVRVLGRCRELNGSCQRLNSGRCGVR
jgi:hypothetical protein